MIYTWVHHDGRWRKRQWGKLGAGGGHTNFVLHDFRGKLAWIMHEHWTIDLIFIYRGSEVRGCHICVRRFSHSCTYVRHRNRNVRLIDGTCDCPCLWSPHHILLTPSCTHIRCARSLCLYRRQWREGDRTRESSVHCFHVVVTCPTYGLQTLYPEFRQKAIGWILFRYLNCTATQVWI
jgi:hypothetical protein